MLDTSLSRVAFPASAPSTQHISKFHAFALGSVTIAAIAGKTMNTATASNGRNIDIPSRYVCPITLQIMTRPLMTRHGHNFERSAIIEWLNTGKDYCPLTREPMCLSDLLPNRPLQQQIQSWRIQHAIPEPQVRHEDFLPVIINLSQSKKREVLRRSRLLGF